MCLLAPSECGLQQLIDQCAKYRHDHDILYNPLKSKCVIFQQRSYRLTIPSVRLHHVHGQYLQYVDNIKYMGVILSNPKDDLDICHVNCDVYMLVLISYCEDWLF